MKNTRAKALTLHIPVTAMIAACLSLYASARSHAAIPLTEATLGVTSGPSDAPVSMLVFSDYACPYSSQLYFQIESLRRTYPSQLRIVMKQDPLAIHEDSLLAHEAALAAGAQGKFNAMSELLFSNQKRLDHDSLLSYAAQIHLDMVAFRNALDRHLYRPVVVEDLLEARAFGIDSTPTIFLNGHRLNGLQSLEILNKSVVAELASAPSLAAAAHSAGAKVLTSEEGDYSNLSPALFADLKKASPLSRGPASAPVTIVEFSDFQCPFCKRAVQPLEELLVQRPGKVHLIFRSFPLDFHHFSELAHEAAYAAAAQGKFWQMHDLLFANQSHLERSDLDRYAAQLQLEMASFKRALDSHAYSGAIAADRALGERFEVDGTPTLFVNGKRVAGARSLVELEQLVDEQVRENGSPGLLQAQVVAAQSTEDTDFVVLGSNAAPIRVTWFADVRSPLAQPEAAILRDLDKAYPGQLRIQFKTLQLPNHGDAALASRALLAAGAQQKFWPMYDWIAAQAATSPSQIEATDVTRAAVSLGLDSGKLEADLDASATTASLEHDQAEGYRRSITGSPVVFIGQVRIDGIQPERTYRDAIESAIASTHGKTHLVAVAR